MKNMVSGRKSDRNRKNIVFGKIPPKKSVVDFFSVINEVKKKVVLNLFLDKEK